MMLLYSVSRPLRERIRQAGTKVQNVLQGSVYLSEYITLPEAGQHIVLRFELRRLVASLDVLDELESAIRGLVGEEFWAVLLGQAFSQVRPSLAISMLPERLEKLGQVLRSVPVPISSANHAQYLWKDAQVLREELALGQDDWIWEVEVPMTDGEPIVRIVSEKTGPKRMLVFEGRPFQVEYVPPSCGYLGLVKAYPRACQAHKSLMGYIFESTDEFLHRTHAADG